jgi:hypothetical protein
LVHQDMDSAIMVLLNIQQSLITPKKTPVPCCFPEQQSIIDQTFIPSRAILSSGF